MPTVKSRLIMRVKQLVQKYTISLHHTKKFNLCITPF